MKRLVMSPRARADLAELYSASAERFGANVRLRYERLVVTALRDLASGPNRPGVILDDALPPGLLRYHLRHSKGHTPPGERIARPRHFLIFRVEDDALVIVRVLHDAMELRRHL